jgi:hypothetical protein
MTLPTIGDAAPDNADRMMQAFYAGLNDVQLGLLASLALDNLVKRGWEREARELLATPEAADRKALDDAVDALEDRVALIELIELGHRLAPFSAAELDAERAVARELAAARKAKAVAEHESRALRTELAAARAAARRSARMLGSLAIIFAAMAVVQLVLLLR